MQGNREAGTTLKRIGLVPTIGHSFEAIFTDKNTFFSETQGKNPMCMVRDLLLEKGIELIDATQLSSTEKLDLILYFGNIDLQILSKFKDCVSVYFAFEPPAVDLTNDKSNLIRLRKYFDYIATWNDDLVNGEIFLKFNYSVDFFHSLCNNPFEEKKLLTNISGNKQSRHKDELYSKRLGVINHFETFPQSDFEFWGTGWEKENYKNYMGTAVSKVDVYQNYKFALCFENQKELNGYITEKIWDCFICSIVPIYWGAENILHYVPKSCFIDYRDFASVDEMKRCLKEITKEKYDEYIDHIKQFISSDSVDKFKPEAFADILAELAGRRKRVALAALDIAGLRLLKIQIRIHNSVQAQGYTGMLKRIIKRCMPR